MGKTLLYRTTAALYEGVPSWPDPSRLWNVVDDVKATGLDTAPTALRALPGAMPCKPSAGRAHRAPAEARP